ncbi:transcriptional regulator AraC [Gluconobacter thailandicus F149-1 = NBRC 100600]|uniref:AraC family transcriptional regulator n=1 Tax=Gluconobacter thailandicus NBRC 3257 TaxID=1381097 RepID=A0ABQ0IU04_GLUTH|nr:helix-turn-helix domain-containing protein [Gluconobacter thailandicus]AFW02563.1 sorbitol dehydrogenase regulator [Gluconobacter oxydans H24]ANQ41949.1 AraC family transcriptional regulator [Gluconobacter oxydans]KXV54957.1 AraC family transcriptional regulator [Gluconobacter thailandicus]GAD25685.1 AraC family transcriptional regulator [Gluconobacter thailandicus NBRC 3257]GAN94715.1 transcriptional regulator AraC [Gluconobacter thailandicus F149-1 = NBRC 100600]
MPRRKPSRISQSEPVYEVITAAPAHSFALNRHDYPADCAKWNYHPEYELHLITAGNGRYVIGDYVGTFHARSLFLIGPDLPHNWFSNVDQDETVSGRDLVVQIKPAWLQSLVQLCPEFEEITRLLDDAANGIEFHGPSLDILCHQMEDLEIVDPAERVAKFISLLVNLAKAPRHVLCRSWNFQSSKTSGSRVINQIMQLLLSTDLRTVKQAEIARHVKMSPSAFSRLFQQATGDTFTNFVRRLRINRACNLLMTTDDPISSVSTDAGFSNLSNFNRAFLDEKGVTPRKYRLATKNTNK